MGISVKNKRIIKFIILCLILCMTGCHRDNGVNRNILRVGVVLYTQDDPFINALTECMKENFEKYESDTFKITMTVRDGKNDQDIQDKVVGEVIDAGCDILIIGLVDRTEPSNIVKMAKQQNIPVIFFNREPVYEDIMQWDKLYYVGGDAAQSGTLQGEIAAEIICGDYAADRNSDGKIQYVLLEGEAGHQDAIMRTDSVVSTIQNKGIILEKLSYQFANWNRGQAENKMTQLINRYGTDIELVISNNDEMALGAAAAYDALGYPQESRPVILGIDGLDSALEAVKKGYIQGTVYNDKEGQASRISGLALKLFRGEVLPDSDFENGRYIFLPYHKVTADNVDEFLK